MSKLHNKKGDIGMTYYALYDCILEGFKSFTGTNKDDVVNEAYDYYVQHIEDEEFNAAIKKGTYTKEEVLDTLDYKIIECDKAHIDQINQAPRIPYSKCYYKETQSIF